MTDAEHEWVLDNVDRVFPDVHRHVRDITLQDRSLVGRRIRLYGERSASVRRALGTAGTRCRDGGAIGAARCTTPRRRRLPAQLVPGGGIRLGSRACRGRRTRRWSARPTCEASRRCSAGSASSLASVARTMRGPIVKGHGRSPSVRCRSVSGSPPSSRSSMSASNESSTRPWNSKGSRRPIQSGSRSHGSRTSARWRSTTSRPRAASTSRPPGSECTTASSSPSTTR